MTRPGVLTLTLLCACAPGLEPAGPDSAPDPTEPGPYGVGVRTITISDFTRREGEGPRKLLTEIWYPTDDTLSSDGVTYHFEDVLPDGLRARLSGVDLGSVPTSAVRDAEVSDEGPFPIVLFSHGSGGMRYQNTWLTVALASHGFIVAAPDHAGNTLAEMIDAEGNFSIDFGVLFQSFEDRPKDLSAVLRFLTSKSADNPFSEAADESMVGTAGHSFGAVAALREAAFEPSVRAVLSEAPAGYSAAWIEMERPLVDLGIAVQLHGGGKDDTTPLASQRSIWDQAQSPRFLLNLHDAGHFTFTDLCRIDKSALAVIEDVGIGDVLENGCGAENTPVEVAIPILTHTSVAFFNAYLRRSTGSIAYLRPEAIPNPDARTFDFDP